jgi:transposase
LLAIAMVLDGATRLEAARQTGMDRQTLRDCVHRYNEIGISRLLSQLAPGPTLKLTEAQMAELRELVVAGPDPAKHQVVHWRCADVRIEVTRRFSVTVPERTIGKWLRKLELTRLQPHPYHPRRTQSRKRLPKNFRSILKKPCSAPVPEPRSRSVAVFQDEARVGQKGTHACVCRAPNPCDNR